MKIIDKEKELDKKEKEEQNSNEIATELLNEGNKLLIEALKKKDLKKTGAAQAMIESAQKTFEESRHNLKKIREEQKKIDKRKYELIDSADKSSCSSVKKSKTYSEKDSSNQGLKKKNTKEKK